MSRCGRVRWPPPAGSVLRVSETPHESEHPDDAPRGGLDGAGEVDSAGETDRTHRTDRTNRTDRTDKTHRTDRTNRTNRTDRTGSAGEVFRAFLKLGLTSFGGPIAHLGYFRDELVVRRRWLRESDYADLVALGQFLPGPASSQVGFALGLFRAGPLGALAAWAAFTLPSAILLVAFAAGAAFFGGPLGQGVLSGLKIVAVAIVAQAVWGMARTLTPDARRASIAVAGAGVVLLVAGPFGQLAAIALGAVAGSLLCRDGGSAGAPAPAQLRVPVSRRAGAISLGLFALLLVALPIAAAATQHAPVGSATDAVDSAGTVNSAGTTNSTTTTATATATAETPTASTPTPSPTPLQLADSFYRAGALVFGGGHVVLPLLEAETVAGAAPHGWVAPDEFLAGYGAAQAVPGPLFTFAAYLGALAAPGPAGLATAALALVAVFAPGMLLLVGVLPFWQTLRRQAGAQSVLRGVNAAVVGILAAALYDPVFLSAVVDPASFILALTCFALLVSWRTPPWAVVLVAAAGGAVMALLGA